MMVSFKPIKTLSSRFGISTLLVQVQDRSGLFVLKKFPLDSKFSLENAEVVRREIASLRLAELPEFGDIETLQADDYLGVLRRYIPGETLDTYGRRPEVSLRDKVRFIFEVCQKLNHLEKKGILHRDVKPSNILVGEDQKAYLIDFGFSTNWNKPFKNDKLCGTLRYMPPELLGIISAEISARSDIYSLGATLYELIEGHPLHSGDDLQAILKSISNRVPTSGTLEVGESKFLGRIIAKMTESNPASRYQIWDGVQQDLGRYLDNDFQDETTPVGMNDKPSGVIHEAFVGRLNEIQQLTGFANNAAQVQGLRIGIVEGNSGFGKTKLMGEARKLWDTSLVCFRGQGTIESVQRPFQGIADAIHDLFLVVAEQNLAEELREELGENLEVIVRSFPIVGSLLDWTESSFEVGELTVDLLFASLTKLFSWSSRRLNGLLLIDDCQWLDEQTTLWLTKLENYIVALNGSLTIVLSFRTNEVPEGHRLRSLMPQVHIRLAPLSTNEVDEFVAKSLGKFSPDFSQVLRTQTDCSPFMVSEFLRGAVEESILTLKDNDWNLDIPLLNKLQSSSRAGNYLAQRIRHLEQEVYEILEVGAALGKTFALGVVAQISGKAPDFLVGCLDEAVSRQLVVIDKPTQRVHFVHDKVREFFLDQVDHEKSKRIHELAARHYVSKDPDTYSFEIAFHFDRADLPEEAQPFAERSSELAMSQFSLEVANQQLKILLRSNRLNPEKRFKTLLDLARVNMLEGNFNTCHQYLEQAAPNAIDQEMQGQLSSSRGELYFRKGDMLLAYDHLASAIRSAGRFVPRNKVELFGAFAYEVGRQLFSTLIGRRKRLLRNLPTRPNEPLCHLYSRLTYASWFAKSTITCVWSHLRNLNMSEDRGSPSDIAQAYSEHAPVCTTLPVFMRGFLYAKAAYKIRKRINHFQGQGQAYSFMAIPLYAASKFHLARKKFAAAQEILVQTGDLWEANTAAWHNAYCEYRLGNLKEAATKSFQVYKAALKSGDMSSAGLSLSIYTKARRGRVDKRAIQALLDNNHDDILTDEEVHVANAIYYMMEGNDFDTAKKHLDHAQELAFGSGQRNEYLTTVIPWKYTWIRMKMEALGPGYHEEKVELERLALSEFRRFSRMLKVYRNNYPHFLREFSLILLYANKPKRALKTAEKSVDLASKLQMQFDWHQGILERERIRQALGYGVDSELVAISTKAVEEMTMFLREPSRPKSELPLISERYKTISERAISILSSKTEQEILSNTLQVINELFGLDSCFIYSKFKEQPSLVFEVEVGKQREFSRELMREAHSLNKSQRLSDKRDERLTSNSVLASQVHDGICCPIGVNQESIYGLYLSRRGFSNPFTDADFQLAEFISKICSGALELQRASLLDRQKTEALAKQVKELNAAQEQLEAEKGSADRANRAKTVLFSHISHEIRTPLSVIMGFSNLLGQGELSPVLRAQYLRMISQSSEVLNGVLTDIIDVAKIESEKMDVSCESFDLVQITSDIIGLMNEKAREKNITIECNFDKSLQETQIETDKTRFRQVLVNLLSNAIKFSNSNSVTVNLRSVADKIEIRVIDQGIGIPPEKISALFGQFEQLDPAIRKQYGGTGLGLYLSKNIARILGGELILESSSPDSGSTFLFTLPIGQTQTSPQVTKVVPPKKEQTLTGVRALIVDDNDSIRLLTTRLLSNAGCQVVRSACDGYECLEILENESFDVVLMDIQMPGIDGKETTRRIRKKHSSKDLPVIAVSAYDADQEMEGILASGCTTLVSKTRVVLDLVSTVQMYT